MFLEARRTSSCRLVSFFGAAAIVKRNFHVQAYSNEMQKQISSLFEEDEK
jgi:hypothetical protein